MRVVVTGLGCVTPVGNTVEAFRESLYAGRSGIADFDPNFPGALSPDPGLRFRTIAQVKDFDPWQRNLSSGVIASTDAGAQFAIVAARQAATQSGLLRHHNPAEIAVITGCACGGRAADEEAARHLYTRNARVPPMTIVRTMSSSGASNIAIDLRLGGHVLNVATACASGTHAIGLAFQMVRSGMAPAAIAGGYEAPLTFGFLRAWDSMRVVSPTACRPFSADRDGMTLGEGAAMLAIEPLEAALARGARIYAEIVGFGMSADAHHITQPQAEGAAQAIRRALADVANPQDGPEQGASSPAFSLDRTAAIAGRIGYINAHGTGTPANDAAEAAAIHLALGGFAPQIPVSATKSLTGHSIGATGAIEAMASVIALDTCRLPHTAGVTEIDPKLELDIITGSPRPLSSGKEIALSSSLAFGGLNAVLALRRYAG
jgi:3-oxoacyl-[acyl-carrier-protein] synthase II/nodulation protein E